MLEEKGDGFGGEIAGKVTISVTMNRCALLTAAGAANATVAKWISGDVCEFGSRKSCAQSDDTARLGV
jgi:hypothetical protein